MLRHVLSGLVDLVAPPVCAACDSPLSQGPAGFCGACDPLIDGAAPAVSSEQHFAAYLYGGPLATALHRFKYQGRTDAAPALATRLVRFAKRFEGRIDRVTAVPLHRSRLIERGYNQSALLAAKVASAIGARFDPNLVTRVRATRPQVGLDLDARQNNLVGAFSAHPRARDQRVLVIDDVRTTGATLDAVQEALEVQRAAKVWTLALALSDEQVLTDGVSSQR